MADRLPACVLRMGGTAGCHVPAHVRLPLMHLVGHWTDRIVLTSPLPFSNCEKCGQLKQRSRSNVVLRGLSAIRKLQSVGVTSPTRIGKLLYCEWDTRYQE